MQHLATLLLALAAAAPAAAQGQTLDQVSIYHNASFNAAIPGLVWEQEVKVGIAGPLAGFELSLSTYLPNDHMTVEIVAGRLTNPGAVLWSGQVGLSQLNVWRPVAVNLLNQNIHFQVGDYFIIRIPSDSQGIGFQGNADWPADTYYPAGDFWLNGSPVGNTENMGFRTWMWDGPNLEVQGSCPGNVSIMVSKATPNGSVALFHGTAGQFIQTNPNRPCMGVQLSLSQPSFVGFLATNALGGASLNVTLPLAACGRLVQVLDLGYCLGSNPVTLQ